MKPAPFEYERAIDLESALSALARFGKRAKVLAGGQSLIPMLNLRLASAERLIDVGRLNELRYIRVAGNADATDISARIREDDERYARSARGRTACAGGTIQRRVVWKVEGKTALIAFPLCRAVHASDKVDSWA